MPKTKISEFSATPANNTDIDSINIAEGCAPSGINDAIRELMAQLKDFQTGAVGDSFNGPVGTTTAAAGAFTTLSATGAITSTLATGSAPLVIASTTKVANLNVDLLDGADWAAPAALGSTTPAAVSATTLTTSSTVTLNGGTANGVAYLNGSKVVTSGSALTFDGTNLGLGGAATSYGSTYSVLEIAGTASGVINVKTGSTLYGQISNSPNQFKIDAVGASTSLVFFTNSTEQMRLTSTGLGIGTSSPAYKLDVLGTSRIYQSGNTAASLMLNSNQGTIGTGYAFTLAQSNSAGNYNFTIAEGATTYLTLTNSISGAGGNLGLGVTPSAWGGGYKALQVAATGAFASNGSNGTAVAHNAFYDGTNDKYLTTGAASRVFQFNGGIRFDLASSGTAGNAITFTQAMTLDANGVLLVGRTSPSISGVKVDAEGLFGSIKSGNWAWSFGASTATNAFVINDTTSGSSVERARIDSSGNLLVGTTTNFNSDPNWRQTIESSLHCLGLKTTASTSYVNQSNWHASTSGNPTFIEFATETTFTARGSITYNRAGGLTAYNTTSDYRAKEISGPVIGSGALIDSTPVYMGKMKGATQERPMFIAHETPAYAHTGEKDAVDADGNPVYQQMDASSLIPVMWAELQSLRKRLADAGL